MQQIPAKEWKEIEAKAHRIGLKLGAMQRKSKKTVRVGIRLGVIDLLLMNKASEALGISKSKLIRISVQHLAEWMDSLTQEELTRVMLAIRKYD